MNNTTPEEEEYGSGPRGKIIDIICEEWPNSDNEIRVTTLSYRLLNKGVEATEQDIAYVLAQLANRGDIELAVAPAQLPSTDLTITNVG